MTTSETIQSLPTVGKLTIKEFRAQMRKLYPSVRFSVRTVSFSDISRDSAKCLDIISGLESPEQHRFINELAKAAGIEPDRNIRVYGSQK